MSQNKNVSFYVGYKDGSFQLPEHSLKVLLSSALTYGMNLPKDTSDEQLYEVADHVINSLYQAVEQVKKMRPEH